MNNLFQIAVYDVVKMYASEMLQWIDNDIKLSEDEYALSFTEIFIFLIWEMDVAAFSQKMSILDRKSLLDYIIKRMSDSVVGSGQEFKINPLIDLRFNEYTHTEKENDVPKGSPNCLLTNYLYTNIEHIRKNKNVYVCKEKIRPITLSMVGQLNFGRYITMFHSRSRGTFVNIFSKFKTYDTMQKEELLNEFSEILDKDNRFKEKLIEIINDTTKNVRGIVKEL